MQSIKEILNNKRCLIPKGSEELPKRPAKKKTRLFLDNEFFEKGYAASFPKSVTMAFCILAKYANHRTQTCFPAIKTIMKEAGIKNRNTIVNAIKILEAYGIIGVRHSKGKVPNMYILLDCSHWEELNSISLDTVIKIKKKEKTVSKNLFQQYQNQPPNSITVDTRNHINKSSNEIGGEKTNKNPLTPKSREDGNRSPSQGALVVLGAYYDPKDIATAEKSLKEAGKITSFTNIKALLQEWALGGKIVPRKEMQW